MFAIEHYFAITCSWLEWKLRECHYDHTCHMSIIFTIGGRFFNLLQRRVPADVLLEVVGFPAHMLAK
jgi:hypothetical protein